MFRLDSRQIGKFFDRGFLVLPALFSPDEVSEMRAAFNRLERLAYRLGESRLFRGSQFVLRRSGHAAGPAVRIERVVWCGAAEPVLLRYGADARLLVPAAQLLGCGEVSQLINQAHFKLPGDEVAFAWHQDSTHRRYGQPVWRDINGRGSYVQTVIAVDDVTRGNGPLRFIPRSGRLGHVDPERFPHGRLPRELREVDAVIPTINAGGAMLFGPYTFHASSPNLSTAPRRVLINGYAYPGANSRTYPGTGAGRMLKIPAAG